MVSTHTYRYIVAFSLGVASSSVLGVSYLSHVRDSAAALSLMLKEASVIEEVVYQGQTYTVALGVVEPRPKSILKERSIISLAYAKRVLRINPPFALPGVNLDELAIKIDKLSKVESSLIKVEDSLLNSLLASKTAYPDKSLGAALTAEEYRRKFISSGDSEDLSAYIRASRLTAKNYKLESYVYEIIYRFRAPENVRYATERHIIKKESTLSTIHLLRDRLKGQGEVLNSLEGCISSRLSSCDASLVKYPVVDVFSTDPKVSTNSSLVNSFYNIVYGETSPNKATVSPAIYLSDGYCQNPEVLPIVRFAKESVFTRLVEAGDIRFLRPGEHLELPFFRHFIALNLSYIPSNPFTHYTCMMVPLDQGSAVATLKVRNYAQSQNMGILFADDERVENVKKFENEIKGPLLYENDARNYVNTVLAGLVSGDVPRVFEAPFLDLALLFKYKTAGMEYFVDQVAMSEANNVKNLIEGNEIAVTLDRSLFARSPFVALSLYIVYDVQPNELYDSLSLPKNETPYYYLSDLVPNEMLLEEAADTYIRYYSSY